LYYLINQFAILSRYNNRHYLWSSKPLFEKEPLKKGLSEEQFIAFFRKLMPAHQSSPPTNSTPSVAAAE